MAAALTLAFTAVALPLRAETPESAQKRDYAVALFGGQQTDNDWLDPFKTEAISFEESYLVALTGSKRLATFFEHLDLELEGQAVRHFGDQEHWEFNLPVVFRWQKFPWDNTIDTSIAWGIGPSYATEVPKFEIAREGDSQKWLVYWTFEIELGLPALPNWSAVARIHHRSEAFGLVADEGGANALALGIRHRF